MTCHKYRCSAFQIKLDEYRHVHAKNECQCELLSVDLGGVMSILKNTQTYPISKGETAWNATRGEEEVLV